MIKINETYGFALTRDDKDVKISIVYKHRDNPYKESTSDIVFYTDMTNDEVLGMAIKIADDFYQEHDKFNSRKYEIVTMIFYNFIYIKDGSVKRDESNTKRDVFELNESVGLIIDEYLKRYNEEK